MKILNYAAIALSSLLFSPAWANYFLINPVAGKALDPAVRTHIVVAGQGNDLGHAPQVAASAKVKRLIEMNPADQVLYITTSRTDANDSVHRKMGYTEIKFKNKLLNPEQLVNEIGVYAQVASLHFYGHGAIPEGIFLDHAGEHDIRWFPNETTQSGRLVGHFTEDAYVTLNGCNGAHVLAPHWSKMWGVPVSGAMVGTHFESLFNDGNYYAADQGTQAQWARETKSGQSCLGACYRMRPDNANYKGHYGQYKQGLPFYKFFCAGIAEDKCQRGMARALMNTVTALPLSASPTYGEFAQTAREWPCPAGSVGSTTQAQCMASLIAIDAVRSTTLEFARNFTPFLGVTSQCSFGSCYSDPACLISSKTMGCATAGPTPKVGQSTTFVDEYMHYLAGYQLLQK
jgi:hypothetical protein